MQDAAPGSAPDGQDPRAENEVDEHDKTATTIYDVTDTCFNILERLVSATDAALSPEQALLRSDSASSDELPRDTRGLHNNFAFWVDYTGALAPVGACLDDRLHGHDEIKEMVMELLEMVERNLHRLERDKEKNPTFRNTESQHWLSAIDSALDRLHFLARAIRKASARSQDQDLFNFVSDEDKFFHGVAISYVKWKYPKARPSLSEHMGEFIAGRRRALLQKHRHAKKLMTRRAPKPSPSPKPEQLLASSVEKEAAQSAAKLPALGRISRQLPPTDGSRATQVSIMDRRAALQHIHQRPAVSIRSSAPSQQGGSLSAEYPDPPRIKPGEKHVKCPYCLEPLPAAEMRKGTKNEYWERHVNQDLQPYVCLFRRCTSSWFAHQSDWSKHMAAAHSQEWPRKVHSMTFYCDLGHQETVEFDNETDWRNHMQDLSLHPGRSKPPTVAQLQVLVVRKQRLALRDPYVCPFCEDKPQSIAILGDRGNSTDMANILVDHIAEHVKSLSFLSLRSLENKAAEDDSSSANFKNSSANRLRSPDSSPQSSSEVEFLEDISLTLDQYVNPASIFDKPDGRRSYFLVPFARNADFVGRYGILEQLKNQLGHRQSRMSDSSQPRVSLYGPGGIGKTQIALNYVYWLKNTCPDMSIFWVNASNAERFRQSHASIAMRCEVPGYDDPEVDVLPLVKRWLERKDCGRWLMVIDDADDTQTFFGQPMEPTDSSSSNEDNLGRYLPECAHGAILVTTRNKQAGLGLAMATPPIEVRQMDNDESDQLLRSKLAGVDPKSGELSALSSRLEYFPLALVQAAAFIQVRAIRVSQYLQLLDGSDQDLVDLLCEDFETHGRYKDKPRTFAEIWVISFEQIQRQNALAGELLSLMSFLDDQAIPSQFLSYYIERRRDRNQLAEALGVLKAFSFISEETGHGLDIHRFVQLLARKWLAKNGMMRHFAGQALLAVSRNYPRSNFENRAICSAYLPHVYAVLRIEGTGSRDEKVATAFLLHSVSCFCNFQGQWKDAEKLQEQATELQRAVIGAEHPDTLIGMDNLALIFKNQGRWNEAEALEMRVMETSIRALGKGHPDTLTSMANLATIYHSLGKYEEAAKMMAEALASQLEMLGDQHPNTIRVIANLATIYHSLGRYDEAAKMSAEALASEREILGDQHPGTMLSIANLAMIYHSLGRYDEAANMMAEALASQREILGDKHPDTIQSMADLATMQDNTGPSVSEK